LRYAAGVGLWRSLPGDDNHIGHDDDQLDHDDGGGVPGLHTEHVRRARRLDDDHTWRPTPTPTGRNVDVDDLVEHNGDVNARDVPGADDDGGGPVNPPGGTTADTRHGYAGYAPTAGDIMKAAERQGAPPQQAGTRATERDCQATIVEAARLLEYRVLAIRPAAGGKAGGGWASPIQGDPGYPDLTLVHRRAGVLWVELKRSPNLLEHDQEAWRDAFTDAGLTWRLVWVPEQLGQFVQELADRAART
jgi:hypothetical protein